MQVATAGVKPYRGVIECIQRSIKEEGVGSLYSAVGPRLAAVVPMIGIQVRLDLRSQGCSSSLITQVYSGVLVSVFAS